MHNEVQYGDARLLNPTCQLLNEGRLSAAPVGLEAGKGDDQRGNTGPLEPVWRKTPHALGLVILSDDVNKLSKVTFEQGDLHE